MAHTLHPPHPSTEPVRFLTYVLATRPMFFVASVLPLLLGTVWGAQASGTFDLTAALLALMATILVHGGVNVLNDVYDALIGTDTINTEHISPFTGGSRFIQDGRLGFDETRRLGWTLLALAALPGLILTAQYGWPVLMMGATGIGIGVLYSMPPVLLAGRGVGEIAVGIGFGPLPVLGAAWLQGAPISAEIIGLSIPVGLWIALVLLMNEVPDRRADARTGKHTLVVRLGLKRTATLYFSAHVAAAIVAALTLGLAVPGTQALSASVIVLTLVPAIKATETLRKGTSLKIGIQITLAIHAIGCLWLTAWCLAL